MLRTIKNPLFWFAIIMAALTVSNNVKDGKPEHIIRSDGRGYYAYLPAIFIFNDPTFEASLEEETKYAPGDFNQYYLYKTQKGETYNKYFPGIAVLQAPFFGLGCVFAVISGDSILGYSDSFQWAFMLGSIFYSILGMFLFARCLRILFPDLSKSIPWIVIGIYLSTSLLMYNTYTLGLSHHYSFFLFSVFALLVLKIKSSSKIKNFVFLGAVLGLIALVRPTNILVVLAIPLLLGGYEELRSFLNSLFKEKAKRFLLGLIGFLSVIALLFIVWKWQSGHWIVWSYSGEGFNFLEPAFLENLFSFRNGVLVHTPLLLVVSAFVLYRIRKDYYWSAAWLFYFLINAWVISSWWCWDYETSFGNRPFTEHTIFLILPFFYFWKSRKKLAIGFLTFFAIIGAIRYYNYVSETMRDQRFTAKSYFASLQFWKSENVDRWQYPHSVVPFGELTNTDELRNDSQVTELFPETEFALEGNKTLDGDRSNEILYFRVSMEKMAEQPVDGAVLVIHAYTEDQSQNYYRAIPLYNDRLEGVGDWDDISFSGQIPDHFKKFDKVKIYIWNKDHEHFKLRNVRMYIDTYES